MAANIVMRARGQQQVPGPGLRALLVPCRGRASAAESLQQRQQRLRAAGCGLRAAGCGLRAALQPWQGPCSRGQGGKGLPEGVKFKSGSRRVARLG